MKTFRRSLQILSLGLLALLLAGGGTHRATAANSAPSFQLPGGPASPVGETWIARADPFDWVAIASSADGTKLVAAQLGARLHTSTDSGVTWTARGDYRSWSAVASSADGTKLVAVVSGGQIYTSTDSGVTWTARESNRTWKGVASSADGTKLAAVVAGDQAYTSTDSGATWTQHQVVENGGNWTAIASSADGTKLVTVAFGGQIFTSTDSGETWTPQESSRDWKSVASSADGTKLAAVVSGGQIFTSADSGATWTARESARSWTGIASSANGTRLAAVADGTQVYLSSDSGVTWTARGDTRGWSAIASSADGLKLAATEIAGESGKIYTSVGTEPTYSFAVLEDSGAYATNNFATSISAGPPADAGQTVSFLVTNNNNALFSAQPAIAADGTLTFTPALNANGAATVTVVAQDSGGTGGGGVDTSAPQTFTVTVSPVNDPPSITLGQNVAVLQNSGAYDAVQATFGVGPANESSQSIIATTTSNDNTALFSAVPQLAVNGRLTFTPAAAATGSATVTVIVQDSGGTDNGGRDKSTNTFLITVQGGSMNQPPTVTFAFDPVTVEEDSGPFTSDGFAVFSPGPPSEASQTLVGYTVTVDNAALFSAAPAINNAGRLTFTPAANANGSAVVTVVVQDSGGTGAPPADHASRRSVRPATESAGGDRSTNTFVINILPLNDAPTVTFAANPVTVLEDSGPISSNNFALFSPGPANEAAQTLFGYTVTVDNAALFSAAPALDNTGRLTFTPAANANGSAVVTVVVQDSGGTDGAALPAHAKRRITPASAGPLGVDKSTNTFTITVLPVNDAPRFTLPVGGAGSPAGAIWTPQTGAGTRSWTAVASSADGTKLVAADASSGAGGQLYTSSDSGVTWTARASVDLWFALASSADGSKLVAGIYGGSIYTSADSGATWTARAQSGQWISVASSADGSKLAALDAGSDVIYTSTDSGVNWTAQPGSGGNNLISIAMSADASKLVAGGLGRIATSSDSGVTWTAIPAGNVLGVSVASSADGSKLVVASPVSTLGAGIIFASADSGATWTALTNAGLRSWSSVVCSTDGNTLVAAVGSTILTGAAQGKIYISTDSGVTWTERESDRSWARLATSADGSKLVAVANPNEMIYTSVATTVPHVITVNAGSGAYPGGAGFATGISPGPANEAAQTVAFTVTADTPALFAVQPAISPTGTLTFTPGASAGTSTITVTLKDNGGTANGGVDTSAPQTFTITVTASGNTPPTVTFGFNPVTVDEDSGPFSAASFAVFSPGPPSESSQTLVGYTVSVDHPGLFSAAPAIDNTGRLTFTPATNAYGTAVVTVVVQDSGGTGAPAPDFASRRPVRPATSDPIGDRSTNTFVINILPLNDAPTVTFAANPVIVLEDSGPVSSNSFAVFSPGPSNESTQTLVGYTITVDNAALFSAQPAINNTGRLTFTPATNANGSALVTVVVQDSGGVGAAPPPPPPADHATRRIAPATAGPLGVDKSTNTFTITVLPVNDAPSFALGGAIEVGANSGGFVRANFATAIARGPVDEAGQIVTFAVTQPNAALFTVAPFIDGTGTATPGTLHFTLAPNMYGLVTVTVIAHDNGGTANGGVDVSGPQTFTIAVFAPPVNTVPGAQTNLSNRPLYFSATNAVDNSIRVADPDSAALTTTLTVNNGTLTVSATNAVTATGSGTPMLVLNGPIVAINAALQSLRYLSFSNVFGPDTLTVVSVDEGGRTNRVPTVVPILVELPALGGLPRVSLNALSRPGRVLTNVVVDPLLTDTNYIQGITYDPTNNVVYVLPVGRQDGSTNRTRLTVLAQFSDGSTQSVEVPVIIFQPLLTGVGGDATYSGTFFTPLFNPQSSLFEQKVVVSNNTPFDFTALRLTATNLAGTAVTLRNATITNGGLPYVEYSVPIPPGGSVTLTLEYFNATRGAFPPGVPGLRLELLNQARPLVPPPGAAPTAVRGFRGFTPDGRPKFYIEFPTRLGVVYYVQYMDTVGSPWKTSPVIINGTGGIINWLDEGPPNTDSVPSATRFYRIIGQ